MYIQNFQVWETLAVFNLNLSDHACVFAEKYDDHRLQNKERINVLFVLI